MLLLNITTNIELLFPCVLLLNVDVELASVEYSLLHIYLLLKVDIKLTNVHRAHSLPLALHHQPYQHQALSLLPALRLMHRRPHQHQAKVYFSISPLVRLCTVCLSILPYTHPHVSRLPICSLPYGPHYLFSTWPLVAPLQRRSVDSHMLSSNIAIMAQPGGLEC